MRVSVVIPVYNAGPYLREAVESALAQPETEEVLLAEDGSTDDSLRACQRLSRTHPSVSVLRHAGGTNRGAGASRNLAIRAASCPYVAFLDADDYYLEERFRVPKAIFVSDPRAEGVYEACIQKADPTGRVRFRQRGWAADLRTMNERVPPEKLFERQAPLGSAGHCQTNGWVVKRSVFEKTGLFPEHLRLHQDIVMFAKFAAKGRMVAGRLDEPVAAIRIHESNRSNALRQTQDLYASNLDMLVTLWSWSRHHVEFRRAQHVLRCLVNFAVDPWIHRADWPPETRLRRLQRLIALGVRCPSTLPHPQFWRAFRRSVGPFPVALRRG